MNDRDFWLTVRRALLMICKAIEKKYTGKEKLEDAIGTQSVSWLSED